MAEKKWDRDEIIAWCKENNQVAWLKATASKMVEKPVYPKVQHTTKKGKTTWIQDKKQAPTGTKQEPISFVELRAEFLKKFFPEEIKGKKKEPSFYDIIAAL